MQMFRARHALTALALFLTLGLASAGAQETTGTITGIVKDQSGGAIPGVTVTVRNVGTNATLTLVTDQTGVYTAPLLPIGQYEVAVELEGFKRFVRSGLTLSVNDRIRVDATLEPGQLAETVTVVAESPIIRTEQSDISTLINNTQVEQMPLNGRSVIQLVAMQPGVSSSMASTILPGLTGGLANVYVNGNRSSQNSWMIDGADNTDVGSNLGLINFVNVDAVAEVRILRSNYTAEFGRSGGGQINVVTKSGTNNFNGSGFWFGRRDAWDASNFFGADIDFDGKRDPSPLKYDDFGYTIGGPVVRDKLFFFFAQEFRPWERVVGGVQNTRTPTERQRRGDFSEFGPIIDPQTGQQFPGNIIPDNRIDATAKALLPLFPMPNADRNVLGGNRNLSSTNATKVDFREELVRVDYRFSPSHSVYGRFIHDTMPADQPFGEIFGGVRTSYPNIVSLRTDQPGRGFVGAWNWVVSSNMLNEATYQYSRGAIFSELTGDQWRRTMTIPKIYTGNPGDEIIPNIALSTGGYSSWSMYGPYDNTYGSHRVKDTLTWLRGNHSIKTGFLFSWEFKNENAGEGTNGTFTFPGTTTAAYTSTGDAFADFLLGRASAYTEANSDLTARLRFQMYEAFAQDDWKLTPNLTLNLGLRWSWMRQPYEVDDKLTNFDPAFYDPARAYQVTSTTRVPGTGDPLNGIIIAGQNSPYGRRVVDSPWAKFGPRAGFAWDVSGNGLTAVRGGYGMYFDRTLVGIALQNAFVNPPFVQSSVVSAAGALVPTFGNPAAGASRGEEFIPALITMSPDFEIPTTHQWSLGMQRELPWSFAVDVAYVGSAGRNLLRAYDINQTPAGTPSSAQLSARPYRGWANITQRSTDAKSNYHSLQTSLSRRFKDGFQFAVNYTLSRVKTDSPSDRSDLVQDINNKEAEYALAGFDRTHIFGFNYVYELPFYRNTDDRLMYNLLGGWQISGFTRYETGQPLLVTMGGNVANTYGNVSRRPDLVGDPEGPKTIDQWFNTAAFATPAPNTFGSAPRSVVRGPYRHVSDMGLFKNFIITEKIRAQFRLEAFNVFNETNFTSVGTNFSTPSQFGRILGAADPRLVQMGFKVTF